MAFNLNDPLNPFAVPMPNLRLNQSTTQPATKPITNPQPSRPATQPVSQPGSQPVTQPLTNEQILANIRNANPALATNVQAAMSPTVPVKVNDNPNSATSDVFANLITNYDLKDLIARNQKLQQDYFSSLTPTTEENDLQKKLNSIREQANAYNLNLLRAKEGVTEQAIPQTFIDRQLTAIDRNTALKKMAYTNEENATVNELNRLEKMRGAKTEAAKAQIDFNTTDTNFVMKLQQEIDKKKEDILAQAEKKSSSAKQTLQMIMNTFDGLDYNELDPASQAKVATLAADAGLDFNLLVKGMAAAKASAEAKDNQLTEVNGERVLVNTRTGQIVKSLGASSTGGKTAEQKQIEAFQKDAGDMIAQLDQKKISWGAAFDSLKAKYPQATPETINTILGGGIPYDAKTKSFDTSKAWGRATK